jgi:TMEM175 potassium channel family protein
VGDRWHTGRIEAFSDGVFAIAITLLVLDIHVPPTAFDDLWRAIANEWPAYLGFATSFITIGGFWMAHHGLFRRLEYANQQVMRLNLLLLMAVSFLPFPTRLVAEAIHTANAERAAVVFYGASLLVISLLYAALGQAVTRDRSLLRPEASPAEVESVVRQVRPNIGFYLAVIAFAEIAPVAAAIGFLVVAVLVVLRARGDNPVAEPA